MLRLKSNHHKVLIAAGSLQVQTYFHSFAVFSLFRLGCSREFSREIERPGDMTGCRDYTRSPDDRRDGNECSENLFRCKTSLTTD